MILIKELSQQSDIPFALVELFTLDCSDIGGTIYRFTPHVMADGTFVQWRGATYTPIPIVAENYEAKGDGSQAKPSLSISNSTKAIQAAVIALGDIVGAKVVRERTFSCYLDNGVTPNQLEAYPADIHLIEQKLAHDNTNIAWQLTSFIDRLGILLPRRQYTRYGDSRYGSFPGIGLARLR